jgi:uncharacterized protein with von Willebrand factor type A (vWA) domain
MAPASELLDNVVQPAPEEHDAMTALREQVDEISRRAKETIWLTPEPRYSWGLGPCDLPVYAEQCDRVRVVRDLAGLERTAHDFTAEVIGR